MLPMIKSLEAAKESYYLANGEYPYSTELFDVSPESICTHLDYDYYDTSKNGEMLTCGKYFLLNNQKSALDLFYCPDNTANFDSCLAKGDYRVIFSHPSSNKPNIITCYVLNGSKLGKKICYGFPGFEVVE